MNFALVVCFVLALAEEARCHHATQECPSARNDSETVLDLLNVAESVLSSARKYLQSSKISSAHDGCQPMDCADVLKGNPSAESGLYMAWPRNRVLKGHINIYCDMDDDGGAWTVIQRRGDFDSAKDYFYRDWQSYKTGFGDPKKDFWIGNDNLFALTNGRANSLKFDLTDWEGNSTYAVYDTFWIADETYKYTLRVAGYRGTAGDSFTYADGSAFTTKDRDNDIHDSKNCAELFKGGWWYTKCHSSNLNGLYLKGVHESYADGVEWNSFRGQHYSLKDVVIKIRPRDFANADNTSKVFDKEITPQK